MPEASFPATLERFDEMISFILDFATQQGFDQGAAMKVRLAAEEILVNIINHAYPEKAGMISIACNTLGESGKGLALEIRDTGLPFNPLEKEEPDISLPMEDRQIGGLGIFLARKVMDDISYDRQGDTNILKMVKHAS